MLLKKGWAHEKIRAMLKFLDGILRLLESFEIAYSKEVEEFEEESKMSYMTSFEYFGIKKGESNLLLSLLETKFGPIPEAYVNKIKQSNSDLILTWAKRVLSAKNFQEIFDV